MNAEEYASLQKQREKTTEKTVSNYLRKVALLKPVVVIYRNASADTFIEEMVLLKKELNAIGNNYNQAVHKLHTLERIPEFRTWILAFENTQKQFLNKVDEISNRTHQIYSVWSQE